MAQNKISRRSFLRGAGAVSYTHLLAGDELDIVHQKQVCHAVLHAEVLGAAGADGGDKLIGELLAGNVHDDEIGVGALDLGLDGREQMGLAKDVYKRQERAVRVAAAEGLLVLVAVAAHVDGEPLGAGVDHRSTHAVQALSLIHI